MDEDVLNKCDANIKIAKVKNRSDFIETAVDFYNGYLHGQNNEGYVGATLMNTFQSTMNSFEKRMSRQMFKQAVETAKVFWLMVQGLNINSEDVNDLHTDCVEKVKTINGAIIVTADSNKKISVDKKASAIKENAPPVVVATPEPEQNTNATVSTDNASQTVYITRTGKNYAK